MRLPLLLLLMLASLSCGSKTVTFEEMKLRAITLPGGQEVRAEVMINEADMKRGMMFREQLPRGRGLLFVHPRLGRFGYWMYNVKVPLDIIWLDAAKRIVEITPDVPPCPGPPAQCPSYGGGVESQYVLELAAGEAKRLGLQTGQALSF